MALNINNSSGYSGIYNANTWTGQQTFTATGSGTTGSIVTNDITVQPNSGVGGSASMFLDNTNPASVNNQNHTNFNSTTTSFVTASVTPSVIGCLALAACTFGSNGNTLSSVSGGWTGDVFEDGTYHGTYAAHRNALTADTSTTISNTFTLGTAAQGVTEIVLIAPSPGGSPSIVQSVGQPVATANPLVLTLTSTPVAGNLLVAFVSASTFNAGNTVPVPAGWIQVDTVTDSFFELMYVFTRIVQAGDGKSWSFNQTIPGDWISGALYEVQQALTVSQKFEFFNNSAGQFGIFDKTFNAQPLTISPLSVGTVSLGYPTANSSINLVGGSSSSITIGSSGSGTIALGSGYIFRAQCPTVFSAAIQAGHTSVNHASSPYSPSSTTDYTLGCDSSGGTIVINLPALGWIGQTLIVKDETGSAGTNSITINAPGGHTIDGASSVVIGTNYGVVTLYSNGLNWTVFSTANLSSAADFPGSPTSFNTVGSSTRSARADHAHSTSGLLTATATAGNSGFVLVNGTGTIISWTAPNDGAKHRAQLFFSAAVTSNLTGGQVRLTYTIGAQTSTVNILAGGNTTGGYPLLNPANVIIDPNTTITLSQQTAMTVGAATVWAEIWAA
jgi:hypothetical protein